MFDNEKQNGNMVHQLVRFTIVLEVLPFKIQNFMCD